jgi:DNA-binding transcriptional MerR regulator
MSELALQSESPVIPDKLYFKIGEVSDLLGVEAHVLRFWETEFPTVAPKKSGTGHRLYRRKDVERLLRIKDLLYNMRFTIEGARQALHSEAGARKRRTPKAAQQELFSADPLPEIRRELTDILALLK